MVTRTALLELNLKEFSSNKRGLNNEQSLAYVVERQLPTLFSIAFVSKDWRACNPVKTG